MLTSVRGEEGQHITSEPGAGREMGDLERCNQPAHVMNIIILLFQGA